MKDNNLNRPRLSYIILYFVVIYSSFYSFKEDIALLVLLCFAENITVIHFYLQFYKFSSVVILVFR